MKSLYHGDFNKVWITVPTYWGDYGTSENPPCIDFDHPTDIRGKETLSRSLESLCKLEGDFHILIVLAVTHQEYLAEASIRVMQIMTMYKAMKKLHLVTSIDAGKINTLLDMPLLQMNSYGTIRNVQLFVPFILGAEFVFGIDDDEIIDDAKYLDKMLHSFNAKEDIGGLAGPYFDRSGEFRLQGAEKLMGLNNLFLKKNFFMNESLIKAMAESPQIHPSPIAFGGNMVFPRETIAQVCHDPYIPRGEDYDYVINALIKGIRFYFHPDAGIVHLPPDSTGSQAGDNLRKLKADIRRFIYMNVKLQQMLRLFPHKNIDMDFLNPYPGAFITDLDILLEQGKSAISEAYPGTMDMTSIDSFVTEAFETAVSKSGEYFDYSNRWSDVLEQNGSNSSLRASLESSLKF